MRCGDLIAICIGSFQIGNVGIWARMVYILVGFCNRGNGLCDMAMLML